MSSRVSAAIAVVLSASMLTACGSDPKASEPKTFNIAGTLTLGLGNANHANFPDGGRCEGTVVSGLTDMVGMQIVAIDSAGKVVQTGSIEEGTVKWEQITDPGADGYPEQADCVLPFTIEKVVPSKNDLYKLRIKGLADSDYSPASDLADIQLKPTAT